MLPLAAQARPGPAVELRSPLSSSPRAPRALVDCVRRRQLQLSAEARAAAGSQAKQIARGCARPSRIRVQAARRDVTARARTEIVLLSPRRERMFFYLGRSPPGGLSRSTRE